MDLLSFPTLDLRIEKNASKGRRKKALPALERNLMGPLNRELFQMPSSSIQVDTPISTVFNSVESNPSNILSMQAVSSNNSN